MVAEWRIECNYRQLEEQLAVPVDVVLGYLECFAQYWFGHCTLILFLI